MAEISQILQTTGDDRARLILDVARENLEGVPKLLTLWSVSSLEASIMALDAFCTLLVRTAEDERRSIFRELEAASRSDDPRRRGFAALASLRIAILIREEAVPKAREEVIEALHLDDLDVSFLAARTLWPAIDVPLAPFEEDETRTGPTLRRILKVLLRSATENRHAMEFAPGLSIEPVEFTLTELNMQRESLELLADIRGLEEGFLESPVEEQIQDHLDWWEQTKGKPDARLMETLLDWTGED